MKLTGLIAAPHTPCNADYSLNTEAVAKQAKHLADTGVKGVFVGGTTGECHSYSTEERIRLFKTWGSEAKANGLVNISHVGHNSLPDAQDLVKAAQVSEAEAIGAMAPTFFKPASVDELIDWFALLTKVAPQLPFYFYDIPSMTGVSLDTADFLRRGRERIPSLVGVKFTNPDQDLLKECMQVEDGVFDLLFGTDEKLLEGLELGCRGAVGSSYNVAAPIYRQIIQSYAEGNLATAKQHQEHSVKFIDILYKYEYLPATKALMEMLGVPCGPARPPLGNLTENAKTSLKNELEEIGFFDWIS
ncbi:MAG: N-acetylneuraminate lyase [Opitutae bacterium]|nr:N-acetylneuraminate lyase [Opitutae bacterium]